MPSKEKVDWLLLEKLLDEVASKKVDIDEVLSGTTLRVYTFMVKRGVPIGPRELQRLMEFRSQRLRRFTRRS
ncbi:MAG: hypothetical protein JRN15_01810 [Nitrososphaerota archaeon]|nr:hypothetical protein [Nitrososphaerota archaeon]